MGCIIERTGENGIMIICGDSHISPNPCRDCICEADFLCDYPVGNDKTCDAKLCEKHSHEISPGIHYCNSHYIEFLKFEKSGGIKKYLENVRPYVKKRK